MGTNVDPYQRAEGRYRLMRGILEELRDAANPFSILTKGSLILRDVDLLEECAEVADVGRQRLGRDSSTATCGARSSPGRRRRRNGSKCAAG